MMELTSSQKQTIQHQFDCFCKKVLRGEKKNYQRKLISQTNKEVLFSETTQNLIDQFSITDEYPSEKNHFTIKNFDVLIENDLLSEALMSLPKTNRDIILLAYFLEISDTDISKILNMVRRTVQYRRTSSLIKIKKYMEEFNK